MLLASRLLQEIYRSTSLWKSVFSPGVGLCIPNLAAVTADKWAQHVQVCPKEGRYVQSCRSLKLLQRLLESGCDEKLRQCLFLTPPPSKESVKETGVATTSATGTQTQKQASTSVVSCQTRVSVGVAATQTVAQLSTQRSCQTECQAAINTATQTVAQPSTQRSCQTECQAAINTATQTVAQPSTQRSCQTECQAAINTATQTVAQLSTQRSCQTECQAAINTATQTVAQSSTQRSCQPECQAAINTATHTVAQSSTQRSCQTEFHIVAATQTGLPQSTQAASETYDQIVVGTATHTAATAAVACQTTDGGQTDDTYWRDYHDDQVEFATVFPAGDTCWSPTPDDAASHHAPGCLDVGFNPTRVTSHTAELSTHMIYREETWVPWTNEEMAQMAKVDVTTVFPAGDTCWSPIPEDTASHHAPGCMEVGFSPTTGTSYTAEFSTHLDSREETWVPWTNEEMAQMTKVEVTTVFPAGDTCWSPIPEDTASHHAPGCMDVVSNHLDSREETWVPWTNEEMAQMAKEYAASADATMIASPSMPVQAASSTTHVSVTISKTDVYTASAIPGVADALVPWTPLTTTLQSANSYRMPPMTDLPGDVVIVHPDYLDMHTQILGKGAYGSIFRVREVGSPESFPLVCKRILLGSAGVNRSFSIEVTVLHRLQHLAMVPRLYGVVEKTPRLPDHHILMEFLPAAHELCHLVQTGAKLSNYLWLDVLIQVAQAMEAIHAAGVLHNDIKFDNVMVTLIAPAAVKVHMIDFGLSSIGPWSMGYDRYMPRSPHVAPEVYDGMTTSTASDMYSFGLLVEQVNYVINNDKLPVLQAACMEHDPRGRPLIDVIINYLKAVQRYIY